MRTHLLGLCALAFAVIGCQMQEFDSGYDTESNLKTVMLTANMPSDETKAALSTRNGHFSWQENDQISVLATDGKFYTLTLKSGAESHQAVFEGAIPDDASMTTVAVYPPMAENGAENDIYNSNSGTLKYTIANEYDYVEGNTNVPMVATIVEGETPETCTAAFKQIGAVIRFPINALPKEARIVFTVKDKVIQMPYDIVPAEAGTTVLEANTIKGVTSAVTVNYSSELAGRSAEINIPLPTGFYGECSIEVFDANDESLVKNEYNLDRDIERATLLVMNAINAGPMTISEVWPYFVDARVLFSKFAGVDRYAIYIDDIVNPVVVRGEEADGVMQAVIGGNFAHNSTHTIKVATVVNGLADETTMSEPVTFTTGDIRQIKYNTGTRFICAGWDDVAIGVENSTQYNPADLRWTKVPETKGVSERNQRGYHVQLYAEDKSTLLYDEIPFSGQCDYGGTFCNSSWLGMVQGSSLLLPSSLSFGWLEPGKKYYFRVKTLSEPVVFDSPENGNFEPGTSGVTVYSSRGGSAWSELVEMSTDPEYVLGDNEVFHEGFDDMLLNFDFMNRSAAAVPQILTEATDKDNYENRKSAAKLKAWMDSDFSQRKFSEQGFNTNLNVYEYGLTDNAYSKDNPDAPRVFNKYAGSLEGWSVISTSEARNVYPTFGAVRVGQSGTNANSATLRSIPIVSDKLSDNGATKCIVTVKVSFAATKTTDRKPVITISQYRDDGYGLTKIDGLLNHDFSLGSDGEVHPDWAENFTGMYTAEKATYTHIPTWFTVSTSLYMKNGDILEFEHPSGGNQGMLVIGDIKIELDPSDDGTGVERYYGTAPDGTDYDIWNLGGDMPVTFWMGPPALDQFNAEQMSESDLAILKSTYFDPIVNGGYNLIELANPYPASMKVLLQWCTEAGVKMLDKSIGLWTDPQGNVDRITQYADDAAYAGVFVGKDEPGYLEFPAITAMNAAFKNAIGTKARTVNLFPSYANATQLNVGNSIQDDGTRVINSYEEYVQTFVNQMDVTDHNFNVMFDHYCLSKSDKNGSANRGQVKSYQYRDLDVVRSISLEKRIPFLQITHGRPQWDPGYSATIANTDPTWTTDVSATALPEKPDENVYDEQRWLVWSQIALGSKGVSYFCYWTPVGFKGGPFSYHYDGTQTRMYNILKNINQEIQPIGRILMKCHADGAMMTNPSGRFVLYQNDGLGLPSYGPVLSLARGNNEDVVAGCFRDATTGEYKVLVTHKAPAVSNGEAKTPSIATMTFDRSMVTKVKLHTVTLNDHNSAATTVVTEQSVPDGTLTLSIPDGTAVLVEFPETANISFN